MHGGYGFTDEYPVSRMYRAARYGSLGGGTSETLRDLIGKRLVAEEDTAAVLHFAGPVKPWQDDYPPGPARDRYRRFRAAPVGVR